MNAKSYHAAEFSLETLAGQASTLYLWTFTFKHYMGPDEVGHAWKLIRQASARVGLDCGLRVFEYHPGGHGLHIHVVTPTRVDAGAMWAAVGHKWGRLDVQEIPAERAPYVIKYLFKDAKRAGKLRLWATFGKGAACWAVKVRDVLVDSPFAEFLRAAYEVARAAGDLRKGQLCAVYTWARGVWTGAALRRAPRGVAPCWSDSLVSIRNNCTHWRNGSWPAWLSWSSGEWDTVMGWCGVVS